MGQYEAIENIFASDKGILMALVDGRFLIAENASIDIEREYDYPGIISANTMSHNGTSKDSNTDITIEFDTRRDPYIKKAILNSLLYDHSTVFRLYNEEYELRLENCFYSYRSTPIVDKVVSHVTVESAGELTISER